MAEDQSLTLAVGRMEGQLREVVHTVNNLAQKFEDMARAVDKTSHIPAKVEDIERRVTLLEASENRRVGAVGLGNWLVRLVPGATVAAAIGGILKAMGAI